MTRFILIRSLEFVQSLESLTNLSRKFDNGNNKFMDFFGVENGNLQFEWSSFVSSTRNTNTV